MAKSGGLGMALHQALSFSAPLMRVSRAKAVFWPGCALMAMGPEVLERTRRVLDRAEPGIGLSACCCGQPSRYLEPKRFPGRQAALRRLLARRGVERVYTACPNCAIQLREMGGVQVIPIWTVLAGHIRPEDLTTVAGRYMLHDPCPMRRDRAGQDAVRALLAMTGAEIQEPEHSREDTVCCGNVHMLRTTDPAKSAAIRQKRLEDFPPELGIVSCCEGCLEAFRTEGRTTAHVLELLFGRQPSRGWGRRLRYTKNVR